MHRTALVTDAYMFSGKGGVSVSMEQPRLFAAVAVSHQEFLLLMVGMPGVPVVGDAVTGTVCHVDQAAGTFYPGKTLHKSAVSVEPVVDGDGKITGPFCFRQIGKGRRTVEVVVQIGFTDLRTGKFVAAHDPFAAAGDPAQIGTLAVPQFLIGIPGRGAFHFLKESPIFSWSRFSKAVQKALRRNV